MATIAVPLTYDVGGGDRVHSPLVEASVAGVRAKLVVDTGATDHVLTLSLAKRAGLECRPGEPGTDVSGAPVESWEIATSVEVDLGPAPTSGEATTVTLRGVFAFAGPPPFEEWGVGGIVSPQRLRPAGVVILDFDRQVLSLLDDDTDVPEAVASVHKEHANFVSIGVDRDAGGLLTATATKAPFNGGVRFLDSGAPAAEDVPTPAGFTGADPPVGLIGMAELAGSVLVIGPTGSGVAQWLVPPP